MSLETENIELKVMTNKGGKERGERMRREKGKREKINMKRDRIRLPQFPTDI